MKNTKAVAKATICIAFPVPAVENGEIVFSETTETYELSNFTIPSGLENEKEIKEYLDTLLDASDCDVAYIDSVAI